MKTTKSELNTLLKRVSELSQISTEKKEGERYHLYLDFNSCYGGYRLVLVSNTTGGHFGAFGESSSCGRLSAQNMAAKLQTIINVLKYSKQQL